MKKLLPEKNNIQELKGRLQTVASLSSVISILDWDQSVNMPEKATQARGASISELSSIVHAKFLAIDHDHLLTNLKKCCDENKLVGKDRVLVEEIWKDYSYSKKLPDDFIRERATLLTESHAI